MSELSPAYGQGRVRSHVSYADVERAAIVILKSERRPTVETLREALGGGSPDTIASALKRFWRDLGTRIEGDPAALTRMPSEIAGLADGLWQRALKLAGDAAKHDDNAARGRLAQIQIENELRAQSFALREKEFETTARARERAVADAQEHIRTLMSMLEADRQALRARDARIAALEVEVEGYRAQLATLVARAVERNRALTERKRALPSKVKTKPRRPARVKRRAQTSPKRSTPRARRKSHG